MKLVLEFLRNEARFRRARVQRHLDAEKFHRGLEVPDHKTADMARKESDLELRMALDLESIVLQVQ